MGLWDDTRASGPRAAQPHGPRVFLAYTPTEHHFAYTLTNDLRQRGVTIEGDPVGAKASVLPRLAQSQAAPEWLIVVLSPSALWSSLISQEMRIAGELLQRQRLRGALAIAATAIPQTDIPPHWPLAHVFDAARDYPSALRQLCAALGMGVGERWDKSQPPRPGAAPSSDPAQQETALLPIAADPAQEETALIAALDYSREETRVIPSLARAHAPRSATLPASDVGAQSGAQSGVAVRKPQQSTQKVARNAPSARGVTRRSLLSAGAAVAATALAGGVFYLWRTTPRTPPPAPGPTVRWRYLINSNATTPALEANGSVYVGTADGHFYALDTASHTLRWAYDAQAPIRPDDPIIEKGAVYCCNTDGAIFKLNDNSGIESDAQRLLWRFLKPRALILTPALSAGVLYVSCQHYRLFAVNSQTGEIIWTASPPFNPTSPPTLDGDRLYVAGLDALFALKSSTNAPIWTTPVGGIIETSVLLSNGVLYVCRKTNKAFAFDAATGRLRWSFNTPGQIYFAPVMSEPLDAVYFGDSSGYLYALDAQTGAMRWRQKLDSAVVSPKLINGRLYAASSNGYLYALDAQTGLIHWQAVVGQGVVSPLGAGANTLYVGGGDGYLYALDAS